MRAREFGGAARALVATCLVVSAAGCAATKQAPVETKGMCGFLGADCARLTPGKDGQAAMRYVNPNAQWTQYNKIIVEPVTFWGTDQTSVSAEDQQKLTSYFYGVLTKDLGQKFKIVDHAEPGTMRLQVALTDVSGATPGLRTISTVVPQLRLLNTLQSAATGSYVFAGGAQVEAKVTDATTGQLLSEAVDRRLGAGSLKAAAQWEWGDVENAMDAWAKQAADRLSSWTSGAATPQ